MLFQTVYEWGPVAEHPAWAPFRGASAFLPRGCLQPSHSLALPDSPLNVLVLSSVPAICKYSLTVGRDDGISQRAREELRKKLRLTFDVSEERREGLWMVRNE